MGKVGVSSMPLDVKSYKMDGTSSSPSAREALYKATAPYNGFVIATVSNKADVQGRPDDYGECASSILGNNVTVAASAGNNPQLAGQQRTFGSSATAVLSVNKGDEIALRSYSTATKAFYYMSALSTAGDLTFVKS